MTDLGSRRNFLRGRFSTRKGPLRPPWALAEEDFLRACSRCGACVKTCPTRIIINGDAGYPTLDFGEGECTFCGDCTKACPTGALQRTEGQAPWSIRASIGEHCLAAQRVECRVCGDQCPAGAITFRPQPGGISTPVLARDLCTGCGTCVAACPTRAIGIA